MGDLLEDHKCSLSPSESLEPRRCHGSFTFLMSWLMHDISFDDCLDRVIKYVYCMKTLWSISFSEVKKRIQEEFKKKAVLPELYSKNAVRMVSLN